MTIEVSFPPRSLPSSSSSSSSPSSSSFSSSSSSTSEAKQPLAALTPSLLTSLRSSHPSTYETLSLNASLQLTHTHLTSLCPELASLCPLLHSLSLSHSSFTTLAHLPLTLRYLALDHNSIRQLDFEPPSIFLSLATLDLSHNRLDDLQGLAYHCPNLRSLIASHCGLKDEGVADLSSLRLRDVDLSQNNLTDLPKLCSSLASSKESLKVLSVKGNASLVSTPSGRKELLAAFTELTFLDDRTVGDEERAGVLAWKCGGIEAEKGARVQYSQQKRDDQERQFELWQQQKHSHVSSLLLPEILNVHGDAEDENFYRESVNTVQYSQHVEKEDSVRFKHLVLPDYIAATSTNNNCLASYPSFTPKWPICVNLSDRIEQGTETETIESILNDVTARLPSLSAQPDSDSDEEDELFLVGFSQHTPTKATVARAHFSLRSVLSQSPSGSARSSLSVISNDDERVHEHESKEQITPVIDFPSVIGDGSEEEDDKLLNNVDSDEEKNYVLDARFVHHRVSPVSHHSWSHSRIISISINEEKECSIEN